MQFQEKRVIQTQENDEKPHFGPNLVPWAQIQASKTVLKSLAWSVTRYHGKLSPSTISEKTIDPILIKISDGRTDKRTVRQTDKSNFIGHCPTNVERPKSSSNF